MNVMIVEDQRMNQVLLQGMLKSHTERLIVCDDGQQAVDYFHDSSVLPDIVIMDVIMPIKNGFEAAKEIKAEFTSQHIPIIFLTALSDKESFGKCLLYGDDFILKPVDRTTLIAKVQAHYRTAKIYKEVAHQRDELTRYREHVDYEHSVAEGIFGNFMEKCYKDARGVDFLSSSCTVFNGDLVLVFPRPQGGIYAILADATGHGLPAAISTIPVARGFYSMAAKGMSLGTIVSEINGALLRFLPSSMMVAASVVEISANGLEMNWWGGGLPDAYVIDRDGSIIETLVSKHMPFGVLNDDEFEADIVKIRFEPGQKVLFYSDGLTEAPNVSREQFGEHRAETVIKSAPTDLIAGLMDAVVEFTGEEEAKDDLSLLTLTFPVSADNIDENLQSELHYRTSKLPVSLSVHFDHEAIKSVSIMAEVRLLLTGIISGGEDLDLLCSVLSELVANTVEHGLLELDSKLKQGENGFLVYYQLREERLEQLAVSAEIQFGLQFDPKTAKITILLQHNGSSFDSSMVQQAGSDKSYGRGMMLIHQLCDSVTYSGDGRCVTIDYVLDQNKNEFS